VDGNINIEIDALAFSKFALGQPVPRNEDPTLLRGEDRYTDDLSLPGQAYAVIVRSPYADGVIKRD
jgi:carbon-monoxide dehydrogenase large subunit